MSVCRHELGFNPPAPLPDNSNPDASVYCYYAISIADNRFRLLLSMIPFGGLSVCLSVCMSCSCIAHKLQKISTRFLLRTTAPCLFQIVLNFGSHLLTVSSQILSQSDRPPVDLSVGDIRSQIAAEWLQIAQWSQLIAYAKPPSLFQMVSSLTSTTSPSSKCTHKDKLRDLERSRS